MLLILLALLLFAAPTTHAQSPVERFEPMECPFGNPTNTVIECGWLIVPEDYAQPAGKTIQLAVAILRSPSADKAADPVVFVNGGPGGESVGRAPLYASQFAHMLATRDVILVDQRGAGLSQPKLSCIPYDTAVPILEARLDTPDVLNRLKACRADLEAAGINPAMYTTQNNAADFAALRRALGYEQINLYGISYGTMVELVVLRDYAEGIRSAVLDSVLPPHLNAYTQDLVNFERSFHNFVAMCDADLACRTAYPDLLGRYTAARQQLAAEPYSFTAHGKTVRYDDHMFAAAVSNHLVNQPGMEAITDLPAYITDIYNRNYSIIDENTELLLRDNIPLPNMGLGMTVGCADQAAKTSLEEIRAVNATVDPIFQYRSAYFGEAGYCQCEAWGMPPPSSSAPAVTDIPVLILSGALDPLTPVEWAEDTAAHLPNSFAYVLPHTGHVAGGGDCAQKITVAFLADPTTAPDSACMNALPQVAFRINIGATRPLVQGGALLLAGVATVSLGGAGWTLARGGYRRIAWRASLRKMGWIPLALMLALLVGLLLDREGRALPPEMGGVSLLQLVVPLVMAVQAAMVFAPDDEPGLEMQLALPRPISWTILERLGVVFLAQSLTALIGAGLVLALNPEQDLAVLLIGWIPSALFLSGLGLYVTLRWRMIALGALVVGFLWAAFGLFGEFFVPGKAFFFPFNLIQPFLWAIHIHASPDILPMPDYWLNRLFLSGAGIGLIILALWQVRDPEQLLLSMSQKARRKKAETMITADANGPKKAVNVPVVPVQIIALRQVIAIARYEFKMHMQRRAFKVLALVIVLGLGVLMMILGPGLTQFVPSIPPLETLSADQAALVKGLLLVTMSSSTAIVILSMLLPLLVADIVPLDQQQGVDDMLGALPLGRGVYLAGKVAGVWLAGSASMLAGMMVLGVMWWLRAGAFNPLPFIDMLLFTMLPLVFINGGMGVLLGATQPTRRRAVLAVILLFVVPSMLPSQLFAGTPIEFLLPGRLTLMSYYLDTGMNTLMSFPASLPLSALTSPLVLGTLAIGAAQLVGLWLLVWSWQRLRSNE